MVIAFLRHCGCPCTSPIPVSSLNCTNRCICTVAEATFLNLRARATENPDVAFVAVSHSNPQHTQKWLSEVGGPGSVNPVQVIIDESRETYAKWGLGTSSFAHVLSPAGLKAVRTLGKEKGIWNRPTESGSRWQTGGCFGVDKAGRVVWGGVSGRADEMPTFEEAVVAVKAGGSASASARL